MATYVWPAHLPPLGGARHWSYAASAVIRLDCNDETRDYYLRSHLREVRWWRHLLRFK